MNFCLTSPLNVETSRVFLLIIVCFILSRTFFVIQFVPEPESKRVLTLKYLLLLAMTGMIIVGHIETSASFAVLIIWIVFVMGSLVGEFCWLPYCGLCPFASHN